MNFETFIFHFLPLSNSPYSSCEYIYCIYHILDNIIPLALSSEISKSGIRHLYTKMDIRSYSFTVLGNTFCSIEDVITFLRFFKITSFRNLKMSLFISSFQGLIQKGFSQEMKESVLSLIIPAALTYPWSSNCLVQGNSFFFRESY